MSIKDTDDIDGLIKEIEHYQLNMNDPCLGSGFWDEAVKDFIAKRSGKLVTLLEELRKSRGKKLVSLPAENLHLVTVEGRAKGDPASALSDALNKAILYFSSGHDFILLLRDISKLPEDGYRAAMEIHIVPLGRQDDFLSQQQNKALKHIHDHEYGKKHKEALATYPVFNHFAGTDDDGQDTLPDYVLVNVLDSALMNYMIEKKFFDVGRITWPVPAAGAPLPKQMMVRIRRPRIEILS